MNCSGCPYEGNIRYHFIERNTTLGIIPKNQKDIFDKAIKNNTQCGYKERRRLDNKMICIQSCGPKILKMTDVSGMDLKSFSVKTAAESMAYIQANINDWEILDNPIPSK